MVWDKDTPHRDPEDVKSTWAAPTVGRLIFTETSGLPGPCLLASLVVRERSAESRSIITQSSNIGTVD